MAAELLHSSQHQGVLMPTWSKKNLCNCLLLTEALAKTLNGGSSRWRPVSQDT